MTELRALLRENVSRGIELLERRKPHWRADINWKALNLGNCEACVLGQLYGWLRGGEVLLGVTEQDGIITREDMKTLAEHGFEITGVLFDYPFTDMHHEYMVLTDTWVELAQPPA